MKPNWLIVESFPAGTVPTSSKHSLPVRVAWPRWRRRIPEATMVDWMAMNKNVAASLNKVELIFIHMGRDQAGRPHIEKVLEATTENGRLVMTTRKPA